MAVPQPVMVNSWLTGTAAWNFVALSQYICGLRPGHDGLEIEPRLPAHIKTAEFTRIFRGVTYHINVKNVNNTGTVKISAQNATVTGLCVKASPNITDVYVDVTVE